MPVVRGHQVVDYRRLSTESGRRNQFRRAFAALTKVFILAMAFVHRAGLQAVTGGNPDAFLRQDFQRLSEPLLEGRLFLHNARVDIHYAKANVLREERLLETASISSPLFDSSSSRLSIGMPNISE